VKIAVTAASGNLGRLLLRELVGLTGADKVVGIARSPAKIAIDDIDTRSGDYTRPQDWPSALQGVDTLVLISAPTGPWDRVEMHRHVIAGARQAGVRKILFTSVIGNGKEADTLYAPVAALNRQTEQDIQSSGLEWTIARNGLYLEFDIAHIVNAAKADGSYKNNGGTGRCGYISRNELAYATARMAVDDQHNGHIYNLVGECHTQAELVQMVNDIYGIDVRYEEISDQACIDKLSPVRGELVANMLTGCYQCIRTGAYDVSSDFEAASGRPALSVIDQIKNYKANAI
jgi:NAD(P)H dehydrogenase (quinone)